MNWRTTLGGSLSALGTTLMGVGIMQELSGMKSDALLHITLAGFIIKAIGEFFGHLFAADAKAVQCAIQSNNIAMSGAINPSLPTTDKQQTELMKKNP